MENLDNLVTGEEVGFVLGESGEQTLNAAKECLLVTLGGDDLSHWMLEFVSFTETEAESLRTCFRSPARLGS